MDCHLPGRDIPQSEKGKAYFDRFRRDDSIAHVKLLDREHVPIEDQVKLKADRDLLSF